MEKLDEQYEAPIAQGGANVSGGKSSGFRSPGRLPANRRSFCSTTAFPRSISNGITAASGARAVTQHSIMMVVAQRVSTIMHASNILVLEKGKLVGQGTHDQLMDDCSVYRKLRRRNCRNRSRQLDRVPTLSCNGGCRERPIVTIAESPGGPMGRGGPGAVMAAIENRKISIGRSRLSAI